MMALASWILFSEIKGGKDKKQNITENFVLGFSPFIFIENRNEYNSKPQPLKVSSPNYGM